MGRVLRIVPACLTAAAIMALAACGSSNNGSHTANNPAPAGVTVVAAQAANSAATSAPPSAAAAVSPSPAPGGTAAAGPAGLGTPATNPVERLSGTVQSVDAGKVTLKDGGSFSLSPQTVVTKRAMITAADLKTGQTVAITARRQPDNTLLASMIVVFPGAPSGFRLGQSPLDAGNLMTNATIDRVAGSSFHASFPGGGEQVSIAPDAQLLTLAAGTQAEIATGAMITAAVRNGVAQQVSIQ
ncbi:MAG TPA: DUF5666 domain-containing protein [Dehalococcoidia bacterium]|nr:DUF5666 domain-containing protein [Dehalococcoidia bacterium]